MYSTGAVWSASSVVASCTLTDAVGKLWFDPAFSESGWTSIPLRDTWSGVNLDRYYRGRFSWDTGQVLLRFASDDGIEIYCNGRLVAAYGGSCHSTGCFNFPEFCSPNTSTGDLYLTPYLQSGGNLIAV